MAGEEPAKLEMRDTTHKPVVVGRMNPSGARAHGVAIQEAWNDAAAATEALLTKMPQGFKVLEVWVEEQEEVIESGVSGEAND